MSDHLSLKQSYIFRPVFAKVPESRRTLRPCHSPRVKVLRWTLEKLKPPSAVQAGACRSLVKISFGVARLSNMSEIQQKSASALLYIVDVMRTKRERWQRIRCHLRSLSHEHLRPTSNEVLSAQARGPRSELETRCRDSVWLRNLHRYTDNYSHSIL